LNGSEPHWRDERCALGLFHPSSLIVPIYVIPTSGRCSQRMALIAKIRLLKGAGHSELTGHHVIAQSSCNTTVSPIFYVPDCYSESGKGDAAITSTELGAL
jgi:hypothetical protein